jgi:hypothetical protein
MSNDMSLTTIYAVEDRTPRVYPWMNELYLVSASAEVRSAPQEPLAVSTPGLPGGIYMPLNARW